MAGRVQDRVCLVTGSTGIAAAAARRLVAEGARVFAVSRTEEHCAALAGELGAAGAYGVADLRRAPQAEAAVAACVRRWGRIDALFNVAGISGRRFGDGPVHECTEQGWDLTLESNLRSMFLVCRAVLRRMLEQEPGAGGQRGAILNMASVLAFAPQREFFATHAYAASKGAIIAMSRAMAAYYAPQGIRVNAIAPALVRTPMSARAQENADILAFMEEKQPLCRGLMEAEDVTEAALFLLSDGARMVTGQVLSVDAGWCVSG